MKEWRAGKIKFLCDVWHPEHIYMPSLTSDFEKETLMEHVAKGKDGNALVIGCYYGSDLYMIARVKELMEQQGMVYGLDPWNPEDLFKFDPLYKGMGLAGPMDYVKHKIKEYNLEGKIELVQGDSATEPWDKPLSLLVIDGDHSYKMCLSDLNRFEPFVIPGGFVFVHDYLGFDHSWDGVEQAVTEWRKTHKDYTFYTAGSFAIFRKPE